jgi:putative phosphoribosyl transferase
VKIMATSAKRFENRLQAGDLLADHLGAYMRQADAIVLALPRGGVPVGFALVKKLEIPLDIMLVRKLGVPGREEYAMGAIASGGLCVLKTEVLETFDIPAEVIEAVAERERREIERREKLYRAGRRPPQLEGKTVIVVDDGLATGATMLAATKALRKEHPAKVIIAVPVAASESCRELAEQVDEIICLNVPEPFYAVGSWYEDFTQTTDAEVVQLLAEAEHALNAVGETPDPVALRPDQALLQRDGQHRA